MSSPAVHISRHRNERVRAALRIVADEVAIPYAVTASTMPQLGFPVQLDRSQLKRMALRMALGHARRSVRQLLESLANDIDVNRGADVPAIDAAIVLQAGEVEEGLPGDGAEIAQRVSEREQDMLEGVDLVLELLNALQRGINGGLFGGRHVPDGKPATRIAHRLSGGAK